MKKILILALLLINNTSYAEEDFNQQITVDADRQQVNLKENRVTFFDNVVLTQGSMKLNADSLSVFSGDVKGKEIMVATGKPAKFSQKMKDGKIVHGEAIEVRYELEKRVLTLTGNAKLQQNSNIITGKTISYNIKSKEMNAVGDKSKRVKTIFLPQAIKELQK